MVLLDPPPALDLPVAIPLQGGSNLRELGHWRAADGRHVRPGRLYRCAAPVGLTEQDEATLARLRLSRLIDLRGVQERAEAPSAVAGARLVHLPIEPGLGGSLHEILATAVATGQDSPPELAALLTRAYESYACACHDQFRRFIHAVLEADGAPLLFHCTAGKDRTGFAAAILLRALGVSWEDTLADYLATNRLWRRETARHLDLPPALREALMGAHRYLLDAAFAAIDRTAGSFEAYCTDVLQLDPGRRAALRDMLLTR
jgi:protein-tyrosine phosphatase